MDPLDGDLGGTALGQGANAGNFTMANSNATYVFTSAGADAVGNVEIGGSITLNNGLITGTLAVNDLSTNGTAAIAGGTYTVDPTGRVTLVNITPSLNVLIPFAFQLYLDGNGNALELGVDNSQETVGMAYQQTAASTTPFAGTFALSYSSGFGVLNNGHPGMECGGTSQCRFQRDYRIYGLQPAEWCSDFQCQPERDRDQRVGTSVPEWA